MIDYEEFRSTVFNAINRKNLADGTLNVLHMYQKSVYKSNILPSPHESNTDHFLNDFSPKVIQLILNSSLSSNETQISDIYGKILKGYVKILISTIGNQNVFFIEGAVKIFDSQSAFYTTTAKSTIFGSLQTSIYFTTNLKILTTSKILDQISIFFQDEKTAKNPNFHYFSAILTFIRINENHFSSTSFKKCNEIVGKRIMQICQELEGNDLRDVDEKHVNKTLILLNKIDQQNFDALISLIIEINIKFAKSNFLNKRFAGLSAIRNYLSNSPKRKQQICSLIYKEKVIDLILKDFHHQLVNDFISVLIEMINQNYDEGTHFKQFWEVSINQHSSTIDSFFSGWNILIRYLPDKYIKVLVECISKTPIFPESCLTFLRGIVYKISDSQKTQIYTTLINFYMSGNYQVESKHLIVDTICSFIPNDINLLQKLQEESLKIIENNDNLELALKIMMSSCNRIKSQQATNYFDTIVSKISSENSFQFLPLIQHIIYQLNEPLTDQQFQNILDLTLLHLSTNPQQICSFYSKLLIRHTVHQIFTLTMSKSLFSLLCQQNTFNNYIFDLISLLFNDINHGKNKKESQLNGIEELWKLLYRTNSNNIFIFLAQKESTESYISHCMAQPQNCGALNALVYIIHLHEDGINKEFLNISSNKYIDIEEMVTVNLTGELSQCLRVPKNLTYQSVMCRVSRLINRRFESLSFEENGRTIINKNQLIKDGVTLNIKPASIFSRAYVDDLEINKLPSQILTNEQYSTILYDLLKNEEFGAIALKILNEMPTLENEKIIFDNQEFDWGFYLSKEYPYYFIYRLNVIGNYLTKGKDNWIFNFINSGGALAIFKEIIQIPTNLTSESFNAQNYVLLLHVGRRILESKYTKEISEMLNHLNNKLIFDFINLITHIAKNINKNDLNYVLSNLLYILKAFTLNVTPTSDDFSNFSELLELTIFSHSNVIRKTICDVLMMLQPISYQNILLPLLPKAFNSNYVNFFMLLFPVALETEEPENLWNQLTDLMEQYLVPPKSFNLLEKLKFKVPKSNIIHELFQILASLAKRMKVIPNITKVFNFLVDDILLNITKYYEISKELVDLLNILMSIQPSLRNMIIPQLKKVREAIKNKKLQEVSDVSLSSRIKYRGLKNLGATCYMASLLQQMYAIPIFRKKVLTLNLNENDEKWLIELQYLFLKMLLFPSNDIDPSSFVRNWNGWDGKPINPREQQDATEFLQMFLDRIEEKIPFTKELFKGTILHHTDGVSHDFHHDTFEEYVNIPIEVKNHHNIKESFDTYRSPDRFDGTNQYRTDEFGLIDAVQSHRVLTPSPQLIITLKRFEYNLSTMVREKVNTEYVFPTTLDISPITVEGNINAKLINNDDCRSTSSGYCTNYELYGVVIHMGSAQGGHYISHVKEDDGNWYCLNDKNVTSESINDMLNASYGGTITTQVWDDRSKNYITTSYDKGSAYLLFYRRTDYNFDCEIDSVPLSILSRLSEEIAHEILKKIESSQEYLRFISQICVDTDFLLSFFVDPYFNFESLAILSNKCIENCTNDKIFASRILKNVDKHFSILIECYDKNTRLIYTNIICSAMESVSCEESQIFINALLNKINNEMGTLLEKSESFSELFIPFLNNLSRTYDSSNSSVLINTINSIILSCISKGIIADFSVAFEIFTKLLENEIEKAPLVKPIVNPTCIRHFIFSDINSNEYTYLLVILIRQNCLNIEDVLSLLRSPSLSYVVAARCFICTLAVAGDSGANHISSFIEFCSEKGPKYLPLFLKEVSSLAKRYRNETGDSFFAYSSQWIQNWLLHQNPEVRNNTVSCFYAFSPYSNNSHSEKQRSLIRYTFNALITNIPNIKNEVFSIMKLFDAYKISDEDILDYLPTQQFFSLFSWSVKVGKFQAEIAKNGKKFGELCKAFGSQTSILTNPPRLHLMEFVFKAIDDRNAHEFFKEDTLRLFLTGLSTLSFYEAAIQQTTQIVANFIQVVPDDRSEELFNSKLFQRILRVILTGDASVIIRNKIMNNLIILKKPEAFAKIVFQTALFASTSLNEVLRISWKMMNMIPSLSDVFESEGCKTHVWDIVVERLQHLEALNPVRIVQQKDMQIFPALKLLGIFNKQYSFHNKDKKGFLWGNYVSWLASQWEKVSIPYNAVIQAGLANVKMEFGRSGPFIFLETMVQLSNFHTDEIYKSLQHYHSNGIIVKTPPKSQKSATRFLITLCNKAILIRATSPIKIVKFLIDEFRMALNGKVDPIVLGMLADVLSIHINKLMKDDLRPITKDINNVLSTTNNLAMMNESIINLGFVLSKRQKKRADTNSWMINASRVISKVLFDNMHNGSLPDEIIEMIGNGIKLINFISKKTNQNKPRLFLKIDELRTLTFILRSIKSNSCQLLKEYIENQINKMDITI
ncbi:hypothetical protein TRFO_15596 [Tritrichomonas foetus]|uniref:USP domain-containing protein n=1 Tax=Tritrichomonas foetus TaxID=1144522 RepID=A0A1J4KWJ7_9EUKA|nr:hypothetical protein TRFO_15596 [Tritrichomonas foetus]|eukprot:OHT14078.1 hypothetical protein TRFO_15596 [Tritrichomonas foetus]